jgi:hypothetical protein
MDFFDYDPETGRTDYFDLDHLTGRVQIRTVEDVEPLLDLNASLRNEGIKKISNKHGLRHYATVPMTVILELKQKGIDFYDRNDAKRVFQEIETNYPYLKVDNMRHGVK